MKKYIKGLAIGMIAVVGLSLVSIKDIVTSKDMNKMETYHVYVEKGCIDIELITGNGILISKEGIEILPKYEG